MQGGAFRHGTTASKKLGNSVKRNRAKRIIKALMLENSDVLKSGTLVTVAKQNFFEGAGAEYRKDFRYGLKKVGLHFANEKSA